MVKHTLILAGVAALAIAGPAYAKPDHAKGHGNSHAQHSQHHAGGYNVGNCPPGLAKKNNGCLPPGQAKKRYDIGQRFPTNYGYNWNYNQIPYDLRQQYGLTPADRYYYGDGYVYRVDPKTRLVEQIVSAILR